MFAKLFETEDRGQLLVVRQRSAEGDPEVRTFCEPEGLGVCTVAIAWHDTETGWDQQEAFFAKITEAEARTMTDNIFQAAAEQRAD